MHTNFVLFIFNKGFKSFPQGNIFQDIDVLIHVITSSMLNQMKKKPTCKVLYATHIIC